MNLALAATTFAVTVPAELADKTFISSVVLSTRHRPAPVFVGAAAALVMQAALAVLLGRLVALAPHRAVEIAVGITFLAGAAYLLMTRVGAVEAGEPPPPGESPTAGPEGRRADPVSSVPALRIASMTFVVVGLAELGDLTQIVAANLAARSRDPLSVFVGSALALVLVAGVGVGAGRALVRVAPVELLRKISGVIMLALGTFSLVTAIAG